MFRGPGISISVSFKSIWRNNNLSNLHSTFSTASKDLFKRRKSYVEKRLRQLCHSFFLMVWWQDASFCLFFIFYTIHTFIQSHSYNTFIRRHSLRPLSISSSLVRAHRETTPRIELGPALQQAVALLTEPRRNIDWATRTITEPRRTPLNLVCRIIILLFCLKYLLHFLYSLFQMDQNLLWIRTEFAWVNHNPPPPATPLLVQKLHWKYQERKILWGSLYISIL